MGHCHECQERAPASHTGDPPTIPFPTWEPNQVVMGRGAGRDGSWPERRLVCPLESSFSSAERVSQCYILSLPLLSPVCMVPTVPGSKSPSPCSVGDSPSDLEQVTAPCPKRKTRNFLRAGSPISAILVISAEVVLTGTSLPSSLLPLCKLMTSPNLCSYLSNGNRNTTLQDHKD